MAKQSTNVTAPDGTTHKVVFPLYYTHTRAVLGYMRLRRKLPKINPDNESEVTRWEKCKAWVLIGTAENDQRAELLIQRQGYRNVTEETLVLPITPTATEPDEVVEVTDVDLEI